VVSKEKDFEVKYEVYLTILQRKMLILADEWFRITKYYTNQAKLIYQNF